MAETVKEYMKWILKAEADLRIIEKDIKTEDPVTDVICYHAQQAAEKYLKAYLVFHDQVPEKTHSIERLIELCIKFDGSFDELREATVLTEYAVEIRYPDDFYLPDLEETDSARMLAVMVKEFILRRIDATV